MFKKLKQRIEDGDTTQPTSKSPPPTIVLASTPKKSSRPSSVHNYSGSKTNKTKNGSIITTTKFNRENKWEKRRISSASLTSSRESLLSIDSAATAAVSRISYNGGESSYSVIGTPVEPPLILERFREVGSKDEVLSALTRKCEQVKKLESKINEMALAYMEQTKQRDRLEEALQNLRNEMNTRVEISISDTLSSVKETYNQKFLEKEKRLKEFMQRHEEDKSRTSDIKELNELQREEVAKMKAMLIHSQTEMSRKAAELIEKTKKIENLDKQYMEQRLELEEMQERLDDLSKDRSKHELNEKQQTMYIATLEKEKSALKSQLSELISELTQKSSMLETIQLASDRSHDEVLSLRQTYNLYKAKTSVEQGEKDSIIKILKERVGDLEQRVNDTALSENDQVKALEKERALLEKRLKDTREELTELKSQSNDKITTMGALVATLDEKLKEKSETFENLQKDYQLQHQNFEKKINDMNDKLSTSEENSRTLQLDSNHVQNLQKKVKELDQKCSALKTEKMELEILADKASFLEAQNKLLETRYKETVERLEGDRSSLEEKVKEMQVESRKSSYRSEHTNRRKSEQLETKIEEQNRIIFQYREQLQNTKDDKDVLSNDLSMKETECQEVAAYLEEAMSKTNDLKKEISVLQESLQEKEDLISYIKDNGDMSLEFPSMDSLLKEELASLREMFNSREQDIQERDEEIEELRQVIQNRDDELATVAKKLQDFEENNKLAPRGGRLKLASEKEFQRTIARLTNRVQELELNQCDSGFDNEIEIENRSLKAELDESKQKMKQLQQSVADLKKQYQKQVNGLHATEEQDNWQNKGKKNDEDRDYLEVNFKYLKHVILKYMCSTNEQSRQLVGVIGHLLQFTPRESSIVIDCFDWKLPMQK